MLPLPLNVVEIMINVAALNQLVCQCQLIQLSCVDEGDTRWRVNTTQWRQPAARRQLTTIYNHVGSTTHSILTLAVGQQQTPCCLPYVHKLSRLLIIYAIVIILHLRYISDIQCESKKSPLRFSEIFFPNGCEFLINVFYTSIMWSFLH